MQRLLLLVCVFVAPSTFAALAVYYDEPQEDLRVKVLGGAVVIKRTFAEGNWHPSYDWAPLKLTLDPLDGSVKSVDRGLASYLKTASGVFTYRKRHSIRQSSSGFRWSDRNGNWIEYDAQGLISAYGDRNDIKVTFLYETAGTVKRVGRPPV